MFNLALTVLFVAILSQLLYVLLVATNHTDFVKRYNQVYESYMPRTLLTVPCKGIDTGFVKNMISFLRLDYDQYDLHFVVESIDDPVWKQISEIIEKFEISSKARSVKLLVAGISDGYSQKNHNLLFSIKHAADDVEVFAFADSDARIDCHWLNHLLHQLRHKTTGIATGYRYFIPVHRSLSSLALSSMNAATAQIMGKSRHNQAWGGSMAVKRDLFERLDIATLWKGTISDDLTLTFAVRKAGLRIRFMPRCLTVSFEDMNWAQLFEFTRRQFLITRVAYFKVWSMALICLSNNFIGLWVMPVVTYFKFQAGSWEAWAYLLAGIIHWGSLYYRTYMRKQSFSLILGRYGKDAQKLSPWEMLLNPIWVILMLSLVILSSVGRTIRWRGIKYRLLGACRVKRLD